MDRLSVPMDQIPGWVQRYDPAAVAQAKPKRIFSAPILDNQIPSVKKPINQGTFSPQAISTEVEKQVDGQTININKMVEIAKSNKPGLVTKSLIDNLQKKYNDLSEDGSSTTDERLGHLDKIISQIKQYRSIPENKSILLLGELLEDCEELADKLRKMHSEPSPVLTPTTEQTVNEGAQQNLSKVKQEQEVITEVKVSAEVDVPVVVIPDAIWFTIKSDLMDGTLKGSTSVAPANSGKALMETVFAGVPINSCKSIESDEKGSYTYTLKLDRPVTGGAKALNMGVEISLKDTVNVKLSKKGEDTFLEITGCQIKTKIPFYSEKSLDKLTIAIQKDGNFQVPSELKSLFPDVIASRLGNVVPPNTLLSAWKKNIHLQ